MSDSTPSAAPPAQALPACADTAPATTDTDGAPPPDGYDPSAYRWVPVRRRPRYDGWTEEKQRRFIETLADTGLVGASAKAVGMARESAYRLRRSAHGAAFARAWDAARHHAGGVIEDIAFERAIEGQEREIFDEHGEVVCTRRVHNDRLLMFLLRHLKPERYAVAAHAAPSEPSVADTLAAMEPLLPAPPERLLGPDTLEDELHLADVADGTLSHFLSEQHWPKSPEREKAEANAAREARGKAALEKLDRKQGKLTRGEFADMCFYIDPATRPERAPKRHR